MVNQFERADFFPQMNPESRVWIFQSIIPFQKADYVIADQLILPFLTQWKAHQKDVFAQSVMLFDHFLIIVADETTTQVSGCAGDALHHIIQDFGNHIGKDLFDRLSLPVHTNEGIKFYPKKLLQKMFESGELDKTTILYDPTVKTLHQWRTKWTIPINESWLSGKVSTSSVVG